MADPISERSQFARLPVPFEAGTSTVQSLECSSLDWYVENPREPRRDSREKLTSLFVPADPELGKLIISALLALRDTLKERATLLAPRHPLPTPELYMTPSEEDLLTPDPITPPRSISEAPPGAAAPRPDTHLRRRSSANVQQTLDVTLDFDEGPHGTPAKKLPEFKTLASFQWPHKPISPRLTEKLRKYAKEMDSEKEVQEPLVRKILDDPEMWIRRRRMGVLKMLIEDVFGSDWWKMCVPAILFALQNNLM